MPLDYLIDEISGSDSADSVPPCHSKCNAEPQDYGSESSINEDRVSRLDYYFIH